MKLYHGSNTSIARIDLNHDFDIVVGPIADDRVGIQLFRYLRNFIDMPTLIRELKYKELTIQYYFGTERAVKLLKKL